MESFDDLLCSPHRVENVHTYLLLLSAATDSLYMCNTCSEAQTVLPGGGSLDGHKDTSERVTPKRTEVIAENVLNGTVKRDTEAKVDLSTGQVGSASLR